MILLSAENSTTHSHTLSCLAILIQQRYLMYLLFRCVQLEFITPQYCRYVNISLADNSHMCQAICLSISKEEEVMHGIL